MTESDDGEARPPERAVMAWPQANPPAIGDGVACRCEACDQAWHVHLSMAGFRLRCRCGAWVAVTAPEVEVALASPTPSPVVRRHASLPATYRDSAEPLIREVPTGEEMPPGSLRHGTVRTRQRWNDRAVFELAAILLAFLGPQIVILMASEGREQTLLLPVASLVSAVLVVAICWASPGYSFSGMRSAAGRFFGEMLCVWVVVAGLAILWVRILIRAYDLGDGFDSILTELGLGWSLLLVAVFPAIFEELAFRGMVQGRLMAILGHREGLLATATAFALAHGASFGLPFHFFLGWYLGSLRDRSGSLFPGMLLHFLYNASLVLSFA